MEGNNRVAKQKKNMHCLYPKRHNYVAGSANACRDGLPSRSSSNDVCISLSASNLFLPSRAYLAGSIRLESATLWLVATTHGECAFHFYCFRSPMTACLEKHTDSHPSREHRGRMRAAHSSHGSSLAHLRRLGVNSVSFVQHNRASG